MTFDDIDPKRYVVYYEKKGLKIYILPPFSEEAYWNWPQIKTSFDICKQHRNHTLHIDDIQHNNYKLTKDQVEDYERR